LSVLPLYIALLLPAQTEIPLEGTQPGDLAAPPESSGRCGCHMSFEADQITEPGQSYKATMMALSARDPLFRAALAIAHEDEPRLTPTCLRCHAPAGWLAGRSEPGDGSSLIDEDLDGVTCDVCHRMTEPPGGAHIGDGQYTIAPSTSKRGVRGNRPTTGHDIVRDDFISSSELCGTCHSLFNPIEDAHDADGNNLGFNYFEQRTYEEWRDSAYPGRNQGCIDCHMKRVEGYACREFANRYDDLAHHGMVGGNSFVPQALAYLDPSLDIDEEVEAVRGWVVEQLAKAAELEVRSPASRPEVQSGDALDVTVRFTNKSGHKLPTGYPEGRRVFLEVTLELEGRAAEIISGRWDPMTGDIVDDAQLRTYETKHGRVGEGRTQHLALANQVLEDTRLPPEGFVPGAADMVPVGRDYGSPPYRHWDEHTYSVPMPDGIVDTTTGTVTVRAFHQVTSGAYVRFLLDTLGRSHPDASRLRRAWVALGRAPPEPMVAVHLPITVIERMDPPDAGFPDLGVAPIVDAGVAPPPPPKDDCSCAATDAKSAGWAWAVLPLLWLWRRRSSGSGANRW